MKKLLLALLCLPLYASADGGLPTQPYIYVEGRATVEKPADLVTLHFDVSAMDPAPAAANMIVQAEASKVFALLKSTGIDDKDVGAGNLRSRAEYEGGEAGLRPGKLLGYRVTRPFSVKVRDVTKFPPLVDQLLALKVHEFTGIQEGLSNAEELKDQVWEKAIANARERVEKTLRPAGAKIESLFAISPVAFPDIERNLLGMDRDVSYGLAQRDRIEPAQYRLAPVSVSQSVHLIYLISPVK